MGEDSSTMKKIFKHILIKNNRKECCKIRAEHEDIKIINYEFAKRLKDANPDQYDVKFYGNWVKVKEL